MSDSEIFDRSLRRARRDRAAMMRTMDTRVLDDVSADLLGRVDELQRGFASALVMNGAAHRLIAGLRNRCEHLLCADPGARFAHESGGLQCDEDRVPFGDARFDLIISIGLLDSVNDVPGALVLLRRALKPGGVLFCAFAGAGSFDVLRRALRTVEPQMQRAHPMIDVRAGGDLLARAGFARPVADADTVSLTFADSRALVNMLRANAATNILAQRHAMPRAVAVALSRHLDQPDPIRETINIVTLTGWAPNS